MNVECLKRIAARVTKARTLGLAAEMAFWMFLSLVPLAAVVGLLAARLAIKNWSLAAPLLRTLPPDALDLVRGELVHVASSRTTPIAIVFFVWLASSGVHSIFDAFEATTDTSRPWWKKRLLAIATCVALSLGGVLVALVGGAFDWVARAAHAATPLGAIVWVLRAIVAVALLYAIVAGLFFVGVPRDARARLRLAPGATVVVVLHLALALGYRAYVAAMGNGGAYLAGLAVIGVTMMATYLFSLSILIGLAVSTELVRAPAPTPRGAPPRVWPNASGRAHHGGAR